MPMIISPFGFANAWPIVKNTQGGPECDVKQRVLDGMKKPIPRLYVAAEISSIYGHLYMEAAISPSASSPARLPTRTRQRN